MKNLFFLLGAIAIPVSTAFAANSKVCFEAETAKSIETPLIKVMGKGNAVSGGGYIEIPWDENKTKGLGEASYIFNVKTAGTYYVWARTFWANGCGNSVDLHFNQPPNTKEGGKVLGEDGTYDTWHWVGGRARVTLKAGKNVLRLHNHETGVRVDQFFFCTDADYTPVNIRPITK